jgi:CspA family cold shock protein
VVQRETGTVVWFDSIRGYGFIARDHGGDVFVHHTGIRGGGCRPLELGERVEFTVVQTAKGPRAGDVTAGPARDEGQAVAGERETGTIKWVDTRRGYGFIARDRGGDVFVHHSGIRGVEHPSLNLGERVEFTVVQTAKGPRAEDVTIEPARDEGQAVAEERETGTIKWLDTRRGYGFIVRDRGGGDVFFHVTALRDTSRWPEQGERVEFTVVQGRKGPEAAQVILVP